MVDFSPAPEPDEDPERPPAETFADRLAEQSERAWQAQTAEPEDAEEDENR